MRRLLIPLAVVCFASALAVIWAVSRPASKVPVIPEKAASAYYKAHSILMDAQGSLAVTPQWTAAKTTQDALQVTPQWTAANAAQRALEATPEWTAVQSAQAAQMPAIQELVKICGDNYSPQPTKDSIVCAAKPSFPGEKK